MGIAYLFGDTKLLPRFQETMQLDSYLARINYRGELAPTASALQAIHAAHVCSIPFENMDVHLGRRITLSINSAYHKIVEQHRGGWCYEQNGLFGWALSEIGFQVVRLAGSVMRNSTDLNSVADHLCLLVACPDDHQTHYLADVGFGGSMLHPLLLSNGSHCQPPFTLSINRLDDGHWRFREEHNGKANDYDFLATPADEAALLQQSEFQQYDANSSFVLNLVAQMRATDRHTTLRGRLLTRTDNQGSTCEILDSPDVLVRTLFDEFGLELPEVADLWPQVVARHKQLFE